MGRPHPNTDVARKLWSAIAAADTDQINDVLAPDVNWRVCGTHRLAGEYRGVHGVLDYLARAGELADDLKLALNSIFFNDDGAVLSFHISARRGAKKLEAEALLMLLIRDGKIYRAVVIPTDQAATDRFWS